MNTLAALENTFRDMRKHGCQTVMVTQSLADFGRYSYKPRPAFQDWIERLKTGERLPRGRYFVGKKPGGRLVLIGVSLDIENYCTLGSFFDHQ
ncbi:hypothetical protein NWT87_28440 (plasmid) [Klebsiella pneumoniae]|uniref:hypothetical protein n=1 Tax=Klebsiella pneumoniae TaxID=573 RepID=UPI0021ABAC03|nr:hypothetical protein [Klebsiella pneumoniae]UVG03194.1 hypothetical protein NWT87_28440 [Klebsiella pneumoniae]UVG08691.1 hypothetical protein M2890_28535 [Klebsiella pneumoniae]